MLDGPPQSQLLVAAWTLGEQAGAGGQITAAGKTSGSGSGPSLFGSADFLVSPAKIPSSPAAGCSRPGSSRLSDRDVSTRACLLQGWGHRRPLILFTARIFLSK